MRTEAGRTEHLRESETVEISPFCSFHLNGTVVEKAASKNVAHVQELSEDRF